MPNAGGNMRRGADIYGEVVVIRLQKDPNAAVDPHQSQMFHQVALPSWYKSSSLGLLLRAEIIRIFELLSVKNTLHFKSSANWSQEHGGHRSG
jgi:hypothetical protein